MRFQGKAACHKEAGKGMHLHPPPPRREKCRRWLAKKAGWYLHWRKKTATTTTTEETTKKQQKGPSKSPGSRTQTRIACVRRQLRQLPGPRPASACRCIHIHICMHIRLRIHAYAYTYIHTHTHLHSLITHTHTQTQICLAWVCLVLCLFAGLSVFFASCVCCWCAWNMPKDIEKGWRIHAKRGFGLLFKIGWELMPNQAGGKGCGTHAKYILRKVGGWVGIMPKEVGDVMPNYVKKSL